jgi:hypothetical protein
VYQKRFTNQNYFFILLVSITNFSIYYSSLFEKYIISTSTNISKCDQYSNRCAVDIRAITTDPYSPLELSTNGPVTEKHISATGMDCSQLHALRSMITNEMSIIQGPPGTGKTFLSVQALKVMISSLPVDSPPIIVTAQTNDALDEILLQCDAFGASLVRLGSRTRHPRIRERELYFVRRSSKYWMLTQSIRNLEKIKESLQAEMKGLINMCFPSGLLDPQDLFEKGLISLPQFFSLCGDVDVANEQRDFRPKFAAWLGESLQIGPDPVSKGKLPSYPATPYSNNRGFTGNQDACGAQEAREVQENKDDYLQLLARSIKVSRTSTGIVRPGYEELFAIAAIRELQTCDDLKEIPIYQRGEIYRYWQISIWEHSLNEIQDLCQRVLDIEGQLRPLRWWRDSTMILREQIKIIGCTTTGLLKYRGLIKSLFPEIMLVEEAATVREANIATALLPSLKQLILVGDHKQLSPNVDMAKLMRPPHDIRVSLFERLVKLGLPLLTLNMQRRMVQNLRQLVQAPYPDLTDHVSVLDNKIRGPVPGMGDLNSYFFNHSWPEDIIGPGDLSKRNKVEARMVVGFANYLASCGLPQDKITILTFYTAQVKEIVWCLRRDHQYRVCTVDSYQGRENDVVLLSLVRSEASPQPGTTSRANRRRRRKTNVGFLDSHQRAIVALSRARRGLYIFGNWNHLANGLSPPSSDVWLPMKHVLTSQYRFGSRITLQCPHHTACKYITKPEEWSAAIREDWCTPACLSKPVLCPNELQENKSTSERTLKPTPKATSLASLASPEVIHQDPAPGVMMAEDMKQSPKVLGQNTNTGKKLEAMHASATSRQPAAEGVGENTFAQGSRGYLEKSSAGNPSMAPKKPIATVNINAEDAPRKDIAAKASAWSNWRPSNSNQSRGKPNAYNRRPRARRDVDRSKSTGIAAAWANWDPKKHDYMLRDEVLLMYNSQAPAKPMLCDQRQQSSSSSEPQIPQAASELLIDFEEETQTVTGSSNDIKGEGQTQEWEERTATEADEATSDESSDLIEL